MFEGTHTGYGGKPHLSGYDAYMSEARENPSGQCQDAYGVYTSKEEQMRAKWNREHPNDRH